MLSMHVWKLQTLVGHSEEAGLAIACATRNVASKMHSNPSVLA